MAKGQVKRKKTYKTIQKLDESLRRGMTRDSACSYAGVSRSSFYERMRDDENFRTMVEDAEYYWIYIVEDQKAKLIEKGYRPTIEKELKSRKGDVYGDRQSLDLTHNFSLKQLSQNIENEESPE